MPDILKKTEQTLVKEILARSPFYTPEWMPPDLSGGEGAAERDAGIALARIVARFGDTAIGRLNQAPDLHFLTFLEMIGTTLLPAQPSRVPLTFSTTKDAPGMTQVPERTQASADGADGKPVVFETEKHMVATPAQLVELVCVNPETDEILHHTSAIGGVAPASLFKGENVQQHSLYLGDDSILSIGNATVTVIIKGDGVSALAGPHVKWSYPVEVIQKVGGKDEKVIIHLEVKPQPDSSSNDSSLQIELAIIDPIAETEVLGIRSRWLKCTATDIASLNGLRIDSISIRSRDTIEPDQLFCDDIPVHPSSPLIDPFGVNPYPNRCFYIASSDAFSKKGYSVSLKFWYYTRKAEPPPPNNHLPPAISWEYWDGASWMFLTVAPADTNFSEVNAVINPKEKDITLQSLPDIKKCSVYGKENYWIRMRPIGGPYDNVPKFSGITITYDHPGTVLVRGHIVTADNEVPVLIEEMPFYPFSPLPDPFPMLYMGFDKPVENTPLSIFFAVDPMLDYPADFHPRVNWQYRSPGGAWTDIQVLDGTHGFTTPGMVEIAAPGPMEASHRFGSDIPLFWLRAQFTESFFELPPDFATIVAFWNRRSGQRVNIHSTMRSLIVFAGKFLIAKTLAGPTDRIEACPAPIEVVNPSLFPTSVKKAIPPVVQGVYPNTTWAIQCRTVPEEVLGSGTGEANRAFRLVNLPVVSADIWVDEADTLTPRDIHALRIPGQFREVKDAAGTSTEFWTRWSPVEHLSTSKGSDRHFALDPSTGVITFGDGRRGRIPPRGVNNLRAAYCTGGGARGNLGTDTIATLRQALAFIDSVSNPVAAEGGCDSERVEDLIRRAPWVLRHRGRSVTVDDFASLALDASREVARVKVLQNFDSEGAFRPGWVTVVVVPHSMDPKPLPTPELKRRVEQSLKEKASNVLRLAVIQPSYIRVSVSATLFTRDLDRLPVITAKANSRLTEFLHPLDGGGDGTGWPFGTVPCVSDIYAILEGIEGIDHVDAVGLALSPDSGDGGSGMAITEAMVDMKVPAYSLPVCGDLDVTTVWISGGGG